MSPDRESRAAERVLWSFVAAAPGDPQAVRAALHPVADWSRLATCAVQHGLAGVLATELSAAGIEVPPAAAHQLARATLAARVRQHRDRTSLREALAALSAAGIPTACLKGPVLAERLYAEPSLRPSTDLDLLVAEADCRRAAEVLAGQGWIWHDTPGERRYRERHHHIHLLRRGGPPIELHFRALVGFGAVVPSEALLARAVPYSVDGVATRVLCPEDELVYLALHAASHLLDRLGWLYDLKLFLRSQPPVDGAVVAARARSLHAEHAMRFVVERLARLGAPIASPPPGPRHRAAEQVRRLHGRLLPGAAQNFAAVLFQALLSDRATAAVGGVTGGLARIARRRTHRYLPWLVPDDWSA